MIPERNACFVATRISEDVATASTGRKATNGKVELSDSEGTIDSDILKIAGKISRKIERKEKKHRTKVRSNGAGNVTQQNHTPNCSPVMPSDKKRKSKQGTKSSDMSPSRKTQQEEFQSVPSSKKKGKQKMSQGDGESQGDDESVSTAIDNGHPSSLGSDMFSPRKRKLNDSEDEDKTVSSKKKKRKREKSDSRDGVTESFKSAVDSGVSEDEPKAPARNAAELHNFRFQRKGFQQVDASSTEKPVLLENLPNETELWLIAAPSDLDISELDKQKVSLSGGVTSLDFSDQKCDVVVCRQPSELCPLVINQSTGHLQQGSGFEGQLQIISSIDVPPVPHVQSSPRKEHTIPDSLRQRFVPFGADDPQPVRMSKSKKKKHKKDHKEITDIDQKQIEDPQMDHREQKKKKKKKKKS